MKKEIPSSKLVFLYQTVLNRKFILVMSLSVFAFIWAVAVAWETWFGKLVLP